MNISNKYMPPKPRAMTPQKYEQRPVKIAELFDQSGEKQGLKDSLSMIQRGGLNRKVSIPVSDEQCDISDEEVQEGPKVKFNPGNEQRRFMLAAVADDDRALSDNFASTLKLPFGAVSEHRERGAQPLARARTGWFDNSLESQEDDEAELQEVSVELFQDTRLQQERDQKLS